MTTLVLPQASSEPPEWRRSGRFFVIAAALHGALLAYPLQKALQVATQPVPIELQLATPQPKPDVQPAPRSTDPAPVRKEKQPVRREAIQTVPILAVSPEVARQTNVIAAPPPPVVSDTATRPAPVVAPSVTQARFNAAYLNNPEPKYPPISRRLGEEGRVLLKVRVTADGMAATVDLEKSSNFERLDEAARQAVARWRFVPARRGDEAVEASVIVPIVFRLES